MKASTRAKFKLSPWYSGGVNPLKSRPGWYEIATGALWWNGDWWYLTPGGGITYSPIYWRGLQR